MTTTSKTRPKTITRMRLVSGRWIVVRNGRQVWSHPIRTACEQWAIRNPA